MKDEHFNTIQNLSSEAREKLTKVGSINIGQASKISGVNPSNTSFLLLYMNKKHKTKK